MRVIAGKARRMPLQTLPGQETRPTTDRLKETLFNILQSHLVDCKFLDLFSGSGAIGIEALSRGAEFAFFVERRLEAVRCIRENLERTKLMGAAYVCQEDVLSGIRLAEQKGYVFDIIFMDPPYRMGFGEKVLSCLAHSEVCSANTLIVIEEALETTLENTEELGFRVERVKTYKTNQHIFLRKE